jgi:hypothetical protein
VNGHRLVVRNDHHTECEVITACPVPMRAPRVNDKRTDLEAQFSHQAVATALLVALACLLVRSLDPGSPASARRRDSRRTAAETPKGVGGHQHAAHAERSGGGRQPDHHAGLLGVAEHGRARDEPPDVTARHRVGDDADRDVGHQPVAAHPQAVGVLLNIALPAAAVARAVSGIRVSAAADKAHDRHLTRPA